MNIMHKVSTGKLIAVSFASAIYIFATTQVVSAGATGRVCFDEGCCYIGARAGNLNCSRKTIDCAKDMSGMSIVGYSFSSTSVGSIRDCPVSPSKTYENDDLKASASEFSMKEAASELGILAEDAEKIIQQLKLENFVQGIIEQDRYSDCLPGLLDYSKGNNLDELRCEFLLPTPYKVRNLEKGIRNLTKENLNLNVENNSLNQRIKQLEIENENLTKLWEMWTNWVKEFVNEEVEGQK